MRRVLSCAGGKIPINLHEDPKGVLIIELTTG